MNINSIFKSIGHLFLTMILGYFIGEAIKYINFFGSSQNAPLFCAIGAGSFMVVNFKKKYLNKTEMESQTE